MISLRILKLNGYSLLELLLSLALFGLVTTLLMSAGQQTIKAWQEIEDQQELLREGSFLLQMLCHDLNSTSTLLPVSGNRPFQLFFLKRNNDDDLVTAGYFLDTQQSGYCYRFLLTASETLSAQQQGILEKTCASAAPTESHCELVCRHLLSCEIIPIWKHESSLRSSPTPDSPPSPPILLEVNMLFGKLNRHYFLSTVVALPPTPSC